MKVLKLGSQGAPVSRWQLFLSGQGLPVDVDGTFSADTDRATRAFQARHGLVVDGVVGNQSYGKAGLLGFELVDYAATAGSGFPAEPAFRPISGTAARERAYGRFAYRHAPLPDNPENIRITDDWESRNIVALDLPQLVGVPGAGPTGRVRVHRRVAQALADLWLAWEQQGLLPLVLRWDGGFTPRYIRGSRSVLSNHAFGSAFDINSTWNAYGAQPAWRGEEGCVFDLVPLAHAHGFYWGGHFRSRRDGMHFEYAH